MCHCSLHALHGDMPQVREGRVGRGKEEKEGEREREGGEESGMMEGVGEWILEGSRREGRRGDK